jgi:hypothetical protein
MTCKSELEAILSSIENTSFKDVQSIDLLIEWGFSLTQWNARTGLLMSEAKELLHNARKQAYKDAQLKLQEVGKDYSPMLVKDYINDCCAKENAYYELCERANRATVHSGDMVRTAISALKQEFYANKYTPSNA